MSSIILHTNVIVMYRFISNPRFRAVFATGALVAALLFFSDTGAGRTARDATTSVLAPIMKAAVNIRTFFYGDAGVSGAAGTSIFRESDEYIAMTFRMESFMEENESLRRMLGFREQSGREWRAFEVRAYSRELGKETLLIAGGSRDGVREGDLVVDAQGFLLGAVREVTDAHAKVSLASNAGETFDVELRPGGVHALAKGIGARAFTIQLVPTDAEVRRGDYVVASSPLLPRGALLAEVAEVSAGISVAFHEIRAVLLTRPEHSRMVLVISQE